MPKRGLSFIAFVRRLSIYLRNGDNKEKFGGQWKELCDEDSYQTDSPDEIVGELDCQNTYVENGSTQMVRIACLVMLKNERDLIVPFLEYHAALFGVSNIFVFDNGSTDDFVNTVLEAFEARGGHVYRDYNQPADFRYKGAILGELIKSLDVGGSYDFYIPLDCDEFVVARTLNGFSANPVDIYSEFTHFTDNTAILHVTRALSNVLGESSLFRLGEYSKVIWPKNVFGSMDHGYHEGIDRQGASPYVDCGIVYAHFHYRPYSEVVKFAREKLRSELTEEQLNDPSFLRDFRGMGWHMTGYLVGDDVQYYNNFRDVNNAESFEDLRKRFNEIGIDVPFADFRLPSVSVPIHSQAPHLTIDVAAYTKVQGWAMDVRNPSTPIFLRFLVDGALVWEGLCDQPRPDVLSKDHPTIYVGFDFNPLLSDLPNNPKILTIQDRSGRQQKFLFASIACDEVALTATA